ncbi:MAG TPA: lipase family protein [Verrucomicrobiae bacterium]|jgi:hypothetical protein
MMPELTTKFDLPLARRLAEFSRRAYQDETARQEPCPAGKGFQGSTESRPTILYDALTDAHVLIEDIGDAIVLAFRGTKDIRDWLTDAEFFKARLADTPAPPCKILRLDRVSPHQKRGNQIEIHEGFLRAAESLLPKIIRWLAGPSAGSVPKPLLITGHSLGGALASLAAYFLQQRGHQIRAVYTFASPRVGNGSFRDSYNRQGAGGNDLARRSFRVAAAGDLVPLLPGLLDGYRHVGQECFLCPPRPAGGAQTAAATCRINPSRVWEFLQDEWRAIRALGRGNLDFILQFHSIDMDYLPLLAAPMSPVGPSPAVAPPHPLPLPRGGEGIEMYGEDCAVAGRPPLPAQPSLVTNQLLPP